MSPTELCASAWRSPQRYFTMAAISAVIVASSATAAYDQDAQRPPMTHTQHQLSPLTTTRDSATSVVSTADSRSKSASHSILYTDFSCDGRPRGLYADPEHNCRIFHLCEAAVSQRGWSSSEAQFSFACPSGFEFDQILQNCALTPPIVPCEQSRLFYPSEPTLQPPSVPSSVNNKIRRHGHVPNYITSYPAEVAIRITPQIGRSKSRSEGEYPQGAYLGSHEQTRLTLEQTYQQRHISTTTDWPRGARGRDSEYAPPASSEATQQNGVPNVQPEYSEQVPFTRTKGNRDDLLMHTVNTAQIREQYEKSSIRGRRRFSFEDTRKRSSIIAVPTAKSENSRINVREIIPQEYRQTMGNHHDHHDASVERAATYESKPSRVPLAFTYTNALNQAVVTPKAEPQQRPEPYHDSQYSGSPGADQDAKQTNQMTSEQRLRTLLDNSGLKRIGKGEIYGRAPDAVTEQPAPNDRNKQSVRYEEQPQQNRKAEYDHSHLGINHERTELHEQSTAPARASQSSCILQRKGHEVSGGQHGLDNSQQSESKLQVHEENVHLSSSNAGLAQQHHPATSAPKNNVSFTSGQTGVIEDEFIVISSAPAEDDSVGTEATNYEMAI